MNTVTEERFEIAMVVTDNIRNLLTDSEAECDFAPMIPIRDVEEAQQAAAHLTGMKRALDRVVLERDGFVEDAKRIIARANNLFNPTILRFENEIYALNQRMLAFTAQQKALADMKRAAAEAEARKAQQEAEQKAAAERAKAEEIARENRRKAAEAEAARQVAVAQGDARGAARAAAEAAKQEEQAHAAIENANAKADLFHAQAAASAPAAVVDTKIEGFSTRENYKARLELGVDEARALELIVAAIVLPEPKGEAFYDTSVFVRRELLAYLEIKWTALHKLAKAQKKLMRVPGFEAFDDRIAAGKR